MRSRSGFGKRSNCASKWRVRRNRPSSSSAFSALRLQHEPDSARYGSDLLRALATAGFAVIRVKGSHHFVRHEDGRTTAVPAHSGETIGPGLLHKIPRDSKLQVEDLQRLL